MGLGVIQYTSYSALLNHTMPCRVGLYCSGWVKTGPVGVILTTMDNAFETALVVAHTQTNITSMYIADAN